MRRMGCSLGREEVEVWYGGQVRAPAIFSTVVLSGVVGLVFAAPMVRSAQPAAVLPGPGGFMFPAAGTGPGVRPGGPATSASFEETESDAAMPDGGYLLDDYH